jgi:flagellar biosynthesis protein FliQ
MDAEEIVELATQAAMLALLTSAPILLTGMLVALIIGLLQALTQVQEQTVAFVPKYVAMIAVTVFCLSWLANQLVQYTVDLYAHIPQSL